MTAFSPKDSATDAQWPEPRTPRKPRRASAPAGAPKTARDDKPSVVFTTVSDTSTADEPSWDSGENSQRPPTEGANTPPVDAEPEPMLPRRRSLRNQGKKTLSPDLNPGIRKEPPVPQRRSLLRRVGRVIRRILSLTLIAVLALTLGCDDPQTHHHKEHDTHEELRKDTLTRIFELTASLDTTAPTPETEPALAHTRTALERAGLALALDETDRQPTPSPLSKPTSAAQLVAELQGFAQKTLESSATSERTLARVLASIGAAGAVSATQLAATIGQKAPELQLQTPQAPNPPCPSKNQRPEATTAREALNEVARAQQTGVYTYGVALGHLQEPQVQRAQELMDAYQRSLRETDSWLASLCVPSPPRSPGFALTPDFFTSPAENLAALEDSLSTSYTNLIASSGGDIARWAITQLVFSSQNQLSWGPPRRPLSGLPQESAGAR